MSPATTAEDAADIVIVGGGTAGSILAARLSERTDLKVMLVEAGADTPPSAVPADIADTFPRAFANPGYFWPGLTATMRAGEAPRPFKQPRIMGGGSSVMGLWALRGLAEDYDGWAAAGAQGWAASDLMPYFRRIECDHDYDTPDHGRDGPIPISRVKREGWPGFMRAIGEAASERQIAFHADANGTDEDGIFPLPNSYSATQRASSPSQYLTSAVRARPNLEIRSGLAVERVLLEGVRAVGVEARRTDGSKVTIPAGRVIVSAGGIHSPAMLMRSGIGPGDALGNAGIRCAIDLPQVGRNLQNHLYVHMGALIRPGYRQSAAVRTFCIAGARISSRLPGAPRGDLFLSFMARTMARSPGNQIGVVGAHIYSPASRGSVRIASGDPKTAPLIDFNYLAEEIDRARLMKGARLGCDLLDATAVKAATLDSFMLPANPPLGLLNGPGMASALLGTGVAMLPGLPRPVRRAALGAVLGPGRFLDGLGRGAAFEGMVLASFTSMFHPAGTCAIGKVVDPKTRVMGAEGLHVVDASIMPLIPRANTNLPTSMLAERAADLILAL